MPIDMARALHRGEFMACCARIQHRGIPFDVTPYRAVKAAWPSIREMIAQDADPEGVVFDGTAFRHDRFSAFLCAQDIPWERTDSGSLRTDEKYFEHQAWAFPVLKPFQRAKRTLDMFRKFGMSIGPDDRNRAAWSPFGSKTGRSQPKRENVLSNHSRWTRAFIRSRDTALVYVDWSAQELGIAAALSRDPNMLDDYLSGKPYVRLAQRAGAIPEDGDKHTHPDERAQFKTVSLGVLFGQTEYGIANRLEVQTSVAKALLRQHRHHYRGFWNWQEKLLDNAFWSGEVKTVHGWRMRVSADTNPRSVANFPMQAGGAELLRMATVLLERRGIAVIGTLHDAILCEVPVDRIDLDVKRIRRTMEQAAQAVFNVRIGTEADVYLPGQRMLLAKERDVVEMWDKVCARAGLAVIR